MDNIVSKFLSMFESKTDKAYSQVSELIVLDIVTYLNETDMIPKKYDREVFIQEGRRQAINYILHKVRTSKNQKFDYHDTSALLNELRRRMSIITS